MEPASSAQDPSEGHRREGSQTSLGPTSTSHTEMINFQDVRHCLESCSSGSIMGEEAPLKLLSGLFSTDGEDDSMLRLDQVWVLALPPHVCTCHT